MPRIPAEQASYRTDKRRALKASTQATVQSPAGISAPDEEALEASARGAPTTPPQRHGDRGSRDDDAAALRSPLQRLLRFRDLQDAHVVRSWTQLRNLIQREGFPVGRLLSPNTRVWGLDEIEHWLGNRPVGRLGERKAEAAEAE